MNRWLLLVALVPIALSSLAHGADDIVLADFEGADYGAWTTTGEAFGPGPAHGTLPDQQPVDGFLGRGLVNSFLFGDRSRGTLSSPAFPINRDYLTFLIGGGAIEGKTCVNLLIDDKPVRTATGEEAEHLAWLTWDVKDLKGKSARLVIIDDASDGWGHINLDQITLTDNPKQLPIASQLLYQETYRPQFHFSATKNWLNDPNGLVYYNGQYHLFFQHNPRSTKWGNMTWGHATSPDLVHWSQQSNALEPDALGTMFSGSAVVDWDNAAGFQQGNEKALVAIYTAAGNTSDDSKGKKFTQCLAYSTDAGKTWTKYAKNPVLGHVRGDNRDPKIVWHQGSKRWIMALFLDGSDFAFYSSPDLKNWEEIQIITVPGCGECPDFFPMPVDGDSKAIKWVWTAANGHYLVGSFDGRRFNPDRAGAVRMDFGKGYYAVQSYSDIPQADGRRIQIGWMNNGRYPRMPFNQQMSFPRELKLKPTADGLRLFNLPVKEIASLRVKTHRWKDVPLKPGENLLSGLRGDLFEIQAEIEAGDAAEFGFRLRGEPVWYSTGNKQIMTGVVGSAPLDLVDGRVNLRILVDRTSLEIFGDDGRVSISSCFLPPPDNTFMETFANRGTARIRSLEIHELKSAWPAPAAARE
ncbi:MAG TPA: glycoside hydrolase family 32 protein [Tepidisphaeraceae bacterium]|jgi:sucrose-6-phosphate hydrolase SacC (GH32 family)|nr:glycoside hydrolase family 32 protein [Tepidisphaeraceae bacterium]